jgi:hypothetical protein
MRVLHRRPDVKWSPRRRIARREAVCRVLSDWIQPDFHPCVRVSSVFSPHRERRYARHVDSPGVLKSGRSPQVGSALPTAVATRALRRLWHHDQASVRDRLGATRACAVPARAQTLARLSESITPHDQVASATAAHSGIVGGKLCHRGNVTFAGSLIDQAALQGGEVAPKLGIELP